MQGVLSKHIARLRTNTARHTDERVRLAGEAIAGSLAVKMLGQSPALLSERYLSLQLCCQDIRSVPCAAVKLSGQSLALLSKFQVSSAPGLVTHENLLHAHSSAAETAQPQAAL